MSDNVRFEFFITAFIDVLGQRDAMLAVDGHGLPADEKARETFVALVKQSFGAVNDLHESFERIYKAFSVSPRSPALTGDAGLVEQVTAIDVRYSRFSDGLVIFCPLGNRDGHCSITAVYALIMASGLMILEGLAKGRPVRCGIDVGVSAEMRPGELYGASLAKAYELESRVAEYPRAVVGNDLGAFIRDAEALHDDSGRAKAEAFIARTTSSLLAHDSDGRVIVDYLGRAFTDILDRSKLPELVRPAFSFALQQQRHWAALQNSKLAFRYANLLTYMRQCIGDILTTEEVQALIQEAQHPLSPSKSTDKTTAAEKE